MLVCEIPMRRFRAAMFAVLLSCAALMAQTVPPASAPRTRVALALSGGGSLGLAHIGVLQYFEEHHIPVDAIAGTSMGGLVGGLYATGHTPVQMQAAFAEAVWDDVLRVTPRYPDLPIQARQDRAQSPGELTLRLGRGLSLPAGLSTAEPLDLFLSNQVLAYSTVEDFGQLPTPFRCVATQLETGKPFVLGHGNLARALRATMSVPGIFTPVEWESHVLVDGGLVDNLPTDVAREMGADVVIAVHFSVPLPPARQLRTLPNVLTQAVSVAVALNEIENLRNADLVLTPSLVGIGGTDYKHARELIERGYQAAAQKERFLSTLALSDADWAAYQAARRNRMLPPPPPATRLVAHSADGSLARQAQARIDRDDGPLSLAHIEHELATLVASSALPSAFYRLSPQDSGTIVAELEPSTGRQFFVRPALNFAVANGEPTRGALLGFLTVLPRDSYRESYRVQFAIGYSPRLAGEYLRRVGGTEWFWSPSFQLERRNTSTYANSRHFTRWQDIYSAGFDAGYGMGPRLRLRAGVEAGYEQLSAVAFPGALAVRDGGFVAPRLRADWNSLDEPALPTRGALFTGSMAARYRRSDQRMVPLGEFRFEQNLPLLAGTATASLSAASSFGASLNYFDLFPLGGPTDLHAFLYEQFHATSYTMGSFSYRRPIGGRKLFGQRPEWGAWYEAAGLVQPAETWQSVQSGSLGVLFNSPLGVVTFAVGRTNDGQTRGWINVGRP
jgi:NTE family protein